MTDALLGGFSRKFGVCFFVLCCIIFICLQDTSFYNDGVIKAAFAVYITAGS
jgi:hypothetical protein